jgi:hypothetical protein
VSVASYPSSSFSAIGDATELTEYIHYLRHSFESYCVLFHAFYIYLLSLLDCLFFSKSVAQILATTSAKAVQPLTPYGRYSARTGRPTNLYILFVRSVGSQVVSSANLLAVDNGKL